ncbi:hypothetical protein O6H91_10G025200 [Diphasiastrum complanatum]|uniref:Uncharacterized protein n=1 Tax=Diphasiastrum complanatum TaxID=34168 RepID=A0ACC2CG62_DIPCM|nr:hypothetical protein O6H91_10G025200 [Diphasiastrum complanatum]
MSGHGGSGFVLTPHKLSMCLLLQAYVLPSAWSRPLSLLSSPIRHQLALFLLDLSKAVDGFLEPTLIELEQLLKEALGDVGEVLAQQLASRLLTFLSPEDIFTFVLSLRELLAPAPFPTPESGAGEEQLLLEQNSLLGQFLRRCILAFNVLSFEGTCRLLTDLDCYRRPALTIASELSIKKETFGTTLQQDEEDDDDLDVENLPLQRQTMTTSVGERGGAENSSRTFGVQIVPTEGRQALNAHEFVELQELDGQVGGGGVRDGGFAFAFGDSVNRSDSGNECQFLRTHGQVEGYLREQAVSIEKGLHRISPPELNANLVLIGKLAPNIHRVHYLEYLNCLHHTDYPAALTSLHRYFDYSAGRGAINCGGSAAVDANMGRFQAGLLSLGSMHAHFGHVTQALQALNEAVRIAQQNNDDSCLAHTLAALCHLLDEVGVTVDASAVGGASDPVFESGSGASLAIQQQLLLLLRRCLRRAQELKLPHLIAFSRLSLAKFDLKHVMRLPLLGGLRTGQQLAMAPSDVCKNLRLSPYILSDSLTNQSPIISNATSTFSSAVQRSNGSVPVSLGGQGFNFPGSLPSVNGWSTLPGRIGPLSDSLIKSAGTSHLLRAASWELYGSSPMGRVSTLIHAYCYHDVASADDLSLAYVKLVQHLALHKGYKVALSALDMVSKKFPLVARTRVQATKLQLLLHQALNRGEIKLAQVACGELSALASPTLGVDIDLKFEASFFYALTLLATGDYAGAAKAAQTVYCLCYSNDMQLNSVKVLLLLADIHRKSGSFVTGLPFALASLTLSESLNLDILHATAMVTLAELWLGLGVDHAQRALALLEQCLPLVLGHGGLHLHARTNLSMARCHLCLPHYSVLLEPETVLFPLQEAAEAFEILEDKMLAAEAFYLQAVVYNALGRLKERDAAATSFQRCTLALTNAKISKVAILSI